jgi:hypothetical protein
MDMLSYFLGRLAGGGSSGDNGPVYTNLVYNDDGSITLTDDEGQEHIMECEYVDGRLERIMIDEDVLDAIYEEDTDKLVKLGDMDIDVEEYPSEIGNIEDLIDNSGVLDSTEGTVYEKVELLIEKARANEVNSSLDEFGIVQSKFGIDNNSIVNGNMSIDDNGIVTL